MKNPAEVIAELDRLTKELDLENKRLKTMWSIKGLTCDDSQLVSADKTEILNKIQDLRDSTERDYQALTSGSPWLVGSTEVGQAIYVLDPQNDNNEDRALLIDGMMGGRWEGFIHYARAANPLQPPFIDRWIMVHGSHEDLSAQPELFQEPLGEIYAGTAILGFFPTEKVLFQDHASIDESEFCARAWAKLWSNCRELYKATTEHPAKTVNEGLITKTGYGSGLFRLFGVRNESGQLIGITVEFNPRDPLVG